MMRLECFFGDRRSIYGAKTVAQIEKQNLRLTIYFRRIVEGQEWYFISSHRAASIVFNVIDAW